MINNRQNGRRRGRGSGPRTPNNAPSPGNRQDNRSRGNAAQLHEKYKALARDMQLAGDRVQTEYYLQFADHYFRVLSEGRARFEEQRPRRDDFTSDEDDDQDQDEAANASDGNDRDDRDEGDERQEREVRAEREPRFEREREREPRFDRERSSEGRQRRPRQPRERNDDEADSGEARIALDSLPPAIAVVDGGGDDGERAPRRRTRRPRTDNDDAEIAPAA